MNTPQENQAKPDYRALSKAAKLRKRMADYHTGPRVPGQILEYGRSKTRYQVQPGGSLRRV